MGVGMGMGMMEMDMDMEMGMGVGMGTRTGDCEMRQIARRRARVIAYQKTRAPRALRMSAVSIGVVSCCHSSTASAMWQRTWKAPEERSRPTSA